MAHDAARAVPPPLPPACPRHAKLTPEDIARIWRLHRIEALSQTTIARLMGVSQARISQILTRKAWTHLPAPPEPPCPGRHGWVRLAMRARGSPLISAT